MLVLFALASTAIILAVGLVIDGGYALVQRRASQNAADFAALSGARIIAEWIGGNTTDGTDANVRAAISSTIQVNGGAAITFGAPNGPVYVDSTGSPTGYVGVQPANTIPAGTVGVTVASSRSWRPFFIGLAGFTDWSASAGATAKGGYAAGGPPGAVFPVGIAQAFFNGRSTCGGAVTGNVGGPGACDPQHLTPGDLNVPGGFGWLKFGCVGYGLGQVPPASNGGCQNNKPFLQTEIGPPANSFGCCTQVKLPGSADQIGSLPGNKASADCSYYITNDVVVIVPVWDKAGGTGSNAWYHIVGFTGFQLTNCDGGKDIEGVWRVPFWNGPTTTQPGFAGAPLAVQLVR
ncbi:MAG TPA: pilus assembly protein TadG-related protein [Candidatus Dormibacteraeota bacterium]|nr:pilus assembly protein TadG-related protein [Candidatus Dormibacteraeota bacterium]